jgi:hypothetical protein
MVGHYIPPPDRLRFSDLQIDLSKVPEAMEVHFRKPLSLTVILHTAVSAKNV